MFSQLSTPEFRTHKFRTTAGIRPGSSIFQSICNVVYRVEKQSLELGRWYRSCKEIPQRFQLTGFELLPVVLGIEKESLEQTHVHTVQNKQEKVLGVAKQRWELCPELVNTIQKEDKNRRFLSITMIIISEKFVFSYSVLVQYQT